MKIGVVNVSDCYNLGAKKIAQWGLLQGYDVVESPRYDFMLLDCEVIFFSAVFTWNLPTLAHDANLALSRGVAVEIGGPAATALPEYIRRQVGIEPHVGLDPRFDTTPGVYDWTFTSRGCPHGCDFCLVPLLEGRRVSEVEDFLPAPNVGDNNILATSVYHQLRVVEALARYKKVDINSGFDCRIFARDPDRYYHIWKDAPVYLWRFAFDQMSQEPFVEACIKYLLGRPDRLRRSGIRHRNIEVYCLAGFPGTTMEEALYRARKVIEWGASPYVMTYRPLDLLVEGMWVPEGWLYEELMQMVYYFNTPAVWRSCSWEQYRRK